MGKGTKACADGKPVGSTKPAGGGKGGGSGGGQGGQGGK